MKKNDVFKCSVCGNIVEVAHVGGGTLVCCGKPMELLNAKSADQGNEKHVPVIEKTEKGYLVKVGSVAHPMEDAHFIEWIDLVSSAGISRKYLSPGEKPEAFFETSEGSVSAREYCTVHGLWKSN